MMRVIIDIKLTNAQVQEAFVKKLQTNYLDEQIQDEKLSADEKNKIISASIEDLKKNNYDDNSLCYYFQTRLWDRNINDTAYLPCHVNVKMFINIRSSESNEELLVTTRCNTMFTTIKGGFSKTEYELLLKLDDIGHYGKNKRQSIYDAAFRELKEEIGFLCEFNDITRKIKLNLRNKKNPIFMEGDYKLYENTGVIKKKFSIDAVFSGAKFNVLKDRFKNANRQSLVDKIMQGAELTRIAIVFDNVKHNYRDYIKL